MTMSSYSTVDMLLVVLVLLLLTPVLQWLIRRVQLSQIYDKIPGPKAYPFVGTLYLLFGKKSHGKILSHTRARVCFGEPEN